MGTPNVLPISEVINITVSETPQGAGIPNVNSLGLFTTEAPINPATYGAFGIFISSSAVASAFGTNSKTAAMANAIFSQVPNILSGDGQLVVIPMINAVSATKGKFVTANISANLTALEAVVNGELAVTVNGTAYDLTGLNFSGASTLAQIASILELALPAGINVSATGTQISFFSDKVGSTSTVALAAYSGGGTDLTSAGLLDTSAGNATAGTNSSGETISACITRTLPQVFYCGLITLLQMEDAAVETAAAAIQAQDIIFLKNFSSLVDVAGIISTIQQATEKQTRCLLYTPSQDSGILMASAYAGRAFCVDFTGSNTAGTENLQQLATITPDPGISQTVYATLNAAGADAYVNYSGVPGIYSTGGNDYFDNQYCLKALKFAMQTAYFNFLAQTKTKVPQTETGMNGCKDAIRRVCKQFVTCGVLAPGTWDSSDTFGDPQIFLNNILQLGYYVLTQPIAQQSSAARDEREAPLMQVALKGAGAIQSANLIINFNP